MASVRELSITKLEEYVRFLEEQCTAENILFRGQKCDLPPRPKIARAGITWKRSAQVAEVAMFQQFKRAALPFVGQRKDDWEWLAVAQHHGLPTRLLDWTKNPLAALWFAVQEPITEPQAVVWAYWFDEGRCCGADEPASPFDVKETKIYQPPSLIPRLSAQFGWFTVHPLTKKGYAMIAPTNKERVAKLVIPAASFGDMRAHLDRCGVNNATMFQDLDGLCRHIWWLHTLLSDEPGPPPA